MVKKYLQIDLVKKLRGLEKTSFEIGMGMISGKSYPSQSLIARRYFYQLRIRSPSSFEILHRILGDAFSHKR